MLSTDSPKLKKGSILQYMKGEKMNQIVTVSEIHPLKDVPWLDSPLVDLSDGESIVLDAILPWNTKDPLKDDNKFLIQLTSEDNSWVFDDVSPQYTEDHNSPSIVSFDKDGKKQEIPNPNYVPYEKRRYEYEVISEPSFDITTEPEIVKDPEDDTAVIFYDVSAGADSQSSNDLLESPNISESESDVPVIDNIQFMINQKIADTIIGKEIKSRIHFSSDQINNSTLAVIKPILDNCKVSDRNISFNLDLSLADKSVLDLIKNQFGDYYKDEAINYILSNLDFNIIKNALRDALTSFYFPEEISNVSFQRNSEKDTESSEEST